MKVAINACYGGFGLSEAVYEKLIEWGVPVRKYIEQERDPETGLYKPQPADDGEIIFDRDLSPDDKLGGALRRLGGRYWDTWIRKSRNHPLIVRVIEELGDAASGPHAKLKVVEIPDGVEWEIDEYDGIESIHEVHRSWS